MQKSLAKSEIAVEVVFRIATKHRAEFLQAVEGLVKAAENAPGLAALECFEEVPGENRFRWRESWESEEALGSRLQAEPIRTLMGAIGVLGELERLEVQTSTSSSSSGPADSTLRAGEEKGKDRQARA